MNLVVGSGPAGIAAALALLDRDQPVTLIDVGRDLESEVAATPRQLAGLPYDAWPPALLERLANLSGSVKGGFPMKTNFGSDFAYRGAPDLMPLDVRDAEIIVSLARGGLSNVWGSNVFSFAVADFRGWPIDGDSLAPAYRAVLRHIPLSAGRGDDLEAIMPLYCDRLEPRFLSRQAEQMLRDLADHREALHASGLFFGPSRLGLRTSASATDAGCVRCGLCLHGCPYDLIYRSAHTLTELEAHPRFRYAGGFYATRFAETASGVEVHAVREGGRAPARFEGARLFLGCGAYSTARLILESLARHGLEVTMLESQYFLIPMLHWRNFPKAPEERLQTLSQICLRLRDPAVCPEDVHMLLYTYSRLVAAAVAESPARFAPPLSRALLGRLLALQGYLHSDVSARLVLSLRRNQTGPAALSVAGRTHPETVPTIRRIEARLSRLARLIRASPIPFMTRIAKPGKSYHTGGTFPMQRDPGPLQSDLLGRPMGLARVHVVDASVFPTIPATNLTLTVMANAYRIAAESCALERRASAPDGARIPA
ncbi:MAG TPA: GMC oxidoreductase [Candidatus Limnocylindria bacterium]|nr:GMC oxidoreductase [Candidatus Limnocylindria bacterium]